VGLTPRILVVEDEFLIAMELEQTLRRAGYQVVGPAASLATALELLRQVRPDAAVLDVNLAGEYVTPVAEVLRAMTVPFVLASGYGAADLSDEEVLRDAVNLGKPTRAQRLLCELSRLLGAKERH
jgi:two-component system, response regulator PdtaR